MTDVRVALADHNNPNFTSGFVASMIGHVILLYLILFKFTGAPDPLGDSVIYSVTVEPGKMLGGMSQVPKEEKAQIAPPKKVSGAESTPQLTTPKTEKISTPQPVEPDAEVSLQEKPVEKKVEPKKEEKKVEAKPKKEEKKVPEKKKEEEKPKEKKQNAAEINKDYAKLMQRYTGESSDAGGQGFGAAAVGGKGMGGGVQRPPEFFTYLDLLKSHIKREWRWYDSAVSLVTKVSFDMSPDGQISNVRVVQGSGNSEFDASVMRAVNKASPVPPPPASVYEFFKAVRLSFDPRE